MKTRNVVMELENTWEVMKWKIMKAVGEDFSLSIGIMSKQILVNASPLSVEKCRCWQDLLFRDAHEVDIEGIVIRTWNWTKVIDEATILPPQPIHSQQADVGQEFSVTNFICNGHGAVGKNIEVAKGVGDGKWFIRWNERIVGEIEYCGGTNIFGSQE